MRRRNPIARQLHSPRYRKRVVAMKTIYNRKKTEKESLVEDRRQRSKTDHEVEDRATRTKSEIPKSKTEETESQRPKDKT